MARQYVRFRYSEEDLNNAIQDINTGHLSLNKASLKYSIPKSTLHNKITAKVPNVRKMGPAAFLTQPEEERLENWILAKAKLGFPMHADEVKDAVQKILKATDRPNKFKDDRPGVKWLQLFLNRHPNISKRNTEIISKSRAAVTEAGIREWFSDLRKYLEDENLLDTMMSDPSRIFNADETGMRTCMKSGKVLAPAKNFKNLYEIASGNEKESITVLCNYSAGGVAAPPMVVFPYKRVPKELSLSVPLGWGIGRSDSGWMTAATFFEYIANIFYPWLLANNVELPVILFIDGHKSHYNLDLYEFCIQKKIILYCLYPNSTHILQPCDVSIFRPLKVQWRESCRRHKQKTHTMITRHNFCTLFKEAFDNACQPNTIVNGFRICGLYPLNENAVDYSKCISTRRNDIFQTPAVSDITTDDYKSCLKVLDQFLTKDKIAGFDRRLNEGDTRHTEDSIYNFWKHCSLNATDQNNIERPIVTEETGSENIITESYLDDLPMEIDGLLYPPIHEFDGIISELESASNNLETVQNNSFTDACLNETEESETLTIKSESESSVQNRLDCEKILDIVLENVFNVIRDVNTNNRTVLSKRENQNKNSNGKVVHVISNILIQAKHNDEKSEEIWTTHLHWPKPEESKRKNSGRSRTPMPYAITSEKWIEFHNEQQRKKDEKEDNIRKKKLEREEKKKQNEEKEKKKKEKKKKEPRKTKSQQKRKSFLIDDEEASDEIEDIIKKKKSEKGGEKNDLKPKETEGDVEQEPRRHTEQRKRTSFQDSENEKFADKTITVGNYVIVRYINRNYPGIVKSIDDEHYEVSVMKKIKKQWIWPDIPDQIWYTRNQIVEKIQEPTPDINPDLIPGFGNGM